MGRDNLLISLKSKGFSKKIIKAFANVPREMFLPPILRPLAYEDTALPLENGATISQPCTIAFMLSLLDLKPKQKILEIGSGCGYVLALLAEISPESQIIGLELIPGLARKSKSFLKNYQNIKVLTKNGFQGLPSKAPFDKILISASADNLPKHLYSQLTSKGIIVTPVKNSIFQIKKQNNSVKVKEFPGFVFVPLKY
ncbi:MAG: L-isoaspartyl protein carboxyl methyltransferase [Nanoarchaeota archaeon]|nr:L-isoaspartyl protein carboxyl methyltransferase [Nanoarchaeota archaeon]MBU0976986.1 L-isoaspartyl protein carboxyl methyltransferase [Nanoarchaeota archaeon]